MGRVTSVSSRRVDPGKVAAANVKLLSTNLSMGRTDMHLFAVDAMNWKAVTFLLGFVVVLPVLITYMALASVHAKHAVAAWFALGVVGLLAIALFAQLWAVRVVIDGRKLIVGGGLYRQTIDRDAIRMDAVEPLASATLQFGIRTNGVGMPGLALGWFQPPHGKKLFVLTTGHTPVLVPTTEEFDVVVSPVDTDGFIAAIKAM